ncbi:MAG: hypothetical protein D6795_18160 [Deltaproteobacteria bacterium]|nr:MAG: hypothetical protein D6795_18160 [Deltaproteobacteria bacterium]
MRTIGRSSHLFLGLSLCVALLVGVGCLEFGAGPAQTGGGSVPIPPMPAPPTIRSISASLLGISQPVLVTGRLSGSVGDPDRLAVILRNLRTDLAVRAVVTPEGAFNGVIHGEGLDEIRVEVRDSQGQLLSASGTAEIPLFDTAALEAFLNLFFSPSVRFLLDVSDVLSEVGVTPEDVLEWLVYLLSLPEEEFAEAVAGMADRLYPLLGTETALETLTEIELLPRFDADVVEMRWDTEVTRAVEVYVSNLDRGVNVEARMDRRSALEVLFEGRVGEVIGLHVIDPKSGAVSLYLPVILTGHSPLEHFHLPDHP